jgi:hypothetical protein
MVYRGARAPNALRDSLNAFSRELTAAIIQAVQDSSLAEILDIPLPSASRRGPGRPKGSTPRGAAFTSRR